MVFSVNDFLPDEWKCTVTFSRGGGRDKWGTVLPTVTFDVPDCVYQTGSYSSGGNREGDGFLHLEDVQAVILAPPGVNVRHDDTGVVPALPWLPGPIKFTVVGKPNHGPLGVSIPVREGV